MNIQAAVLAVLICQLGSDSFRVREAAHAALRKDPAAAIVYLHMAEDSKNCEVANRARRILEEHYGGQARAQADRSLNGKRAPWVAWLADDDGKVNWDTVHGYLQRARDEHCEVGPSDWPEYRLATRLLIEDMYRRREPESKVRTLLRSLGVAERRWITTYGMNFDPPITFADLPE